MVIFNSYVKLPEGNLNVSATVNVNVNVNVREGGMVDGFRTSRRHTVKSCAGAIPKRPEIVQDLWFILWSFNVAIENGYK